MQDSNSGLHSSVPWLVPLHYSATWCKMRVKLCGVFTHSRKKLLFGIYIWEMENSFRLDSWDSLHKMLRIHFQVGFLGLDLRTVEIKMISQPVGFCLHEVERNTPKSAGTCRLP